jgi:hypothetical protein
VTFRLDDLPLDLVGLSVGFGGLPPDSDALPLGLDALPLGFIGLPVYLGGLPVDCAEARDGNGERGDIGGVSTGWVIVPIQPAAGLAGLEVFLSGPPDQKNEAAGVPRPAASVFCQNSHTHGKSTVLFYPYIEAVRTGFEGIDPSQSWMFKLFEIFSRFLDFPGDRRVVSGGDGGMGGDSRL